MASKRTKHRRWSCVGKVTYRSERLALKAVDDYEERYIFSDRMNAYECNFGTHWHAGHSRRRRRLRPERSPDEMPLRVAPGSGNRN